jgi:hypothetical protein
MTWVKQTPQNPVWNKESNSSNWQKDSLTGFLLMEDGSYLLQEDLSKIRLNLLTDPDWGQESSNSNWSKVIPQIGEWT